MTILETKFHNDSTKFFNAVKDLFKTDSKAQQQEYNLLKAYEEGDLSIGQVAKILDVSKFIRSSAPAVECISVFVLLGSSSFDST